MVKLGFIVEGDTEKMVLERSEFFSHLRERQIVFVEEIINAKGNGNLLPHNITPYTQVLHDKGATHIIVLSDLDNDKCVTLTKQRIDPQHVHHVVISRTAIEAWFLADTTAMCKYLGDDRFICEQPESYRNPFDEIVALRKEKSNRGVSDKKFLARAMGSCGFSIARAAEHPNCSSARYFMDTVSRLTGK